jgi:hypothetical protein
MKVINQFIIFGEKTGGAKYHADYTALKEDMAKTLPTPVAAPRLPPSAPKLK